MKKRRIALIGLLGALVFAIAGCGNTASESSGTSAAAEASVQTQEAVSALPEAGADDARYITALSQV